MDFAAIIKAIEAEAVAFNVSQQFVQWLVGFLGAMPALKAGAGDLKGWVETGFQIATSPNLSDDDVDGMLDKLKQQAAATDAQVQADNS